MELNKHVSNDVSFYWQGRRFDASRSTLIPKAHKVKGDIMGKPSKVRVGAVIEKPIDSIETSTYRQWSADCSDKVYTKMRAMGIVYQILLERHLRIIKGGDL